MTAFLPLHPGGEDLIVSSAGFDATNVFEETHGEGLRYSLRILNQFFIGFLDESVSTPGTPLDTDPKTLIPKQLKATPGAVPATLEPYPDVPAATEGFLRILRQITSALHENDEENASGERAAELLSNRI